MTSALDGFTVVDFTTEAAGALATMFLGDHGARVIRVVDAGAPALRDGGYVVWDRGKECVRLDLGQVTQDHGGLPSSVHVNEQRNSATAAFVRLVQSADVLVEDVAPNASAGRWASYEWLRNLNPQLVACSITAYGKRGPWKDEPPVDDLVLARVGILASMPGFRPAPVHVVHPLPSVGAAVLAALGIASALYAREDTGRGRAVETSLMAGTLLYQPKVTGENLTPIVFQTHPAGSAPFYSNYECADGNWIQLGCVHARFIGIAGRLLGIEEILAEPRFGGGSEPATADDDEALRSLLGEIIATKSFATWAKAFEAADVPFAPARWTEESLDDPQVLHNDMVVDLEDPARGTVRQMGVGLKLTRTPGAVRGPRHDALGLNALPTNLAKASPEVPNFPSSQATASQPETRLAPPLAGIRVLEITNLIAGPTGGRLLADLGADVIKFEPLTGDMSRPIGRSYFYSVNFNKRSVSVDTRTDLGKEVVQRIAASCDALLANLRPHATERMGITPAINDQLIETHLTGYGWTGPYSKRPGIDPLAQAYMGMQRAQGGTENPPVFPAQLAPTDYTTGAVGALGTVLCLLSRKRTGVVQRAESNLLNGGILLCSQWFSRYVGRCGRPTSDKEQMGLNPFHRLFQVSDGWVYVAADENAQRDAPCAAFGCDRALERATAEGHPNEAPLAEALADQLASLAVATCLDRLRAAGVPAAPALPGDSAIFLGYPQAIENDMVANRVHPNAGALQVAWNYIGFGDTDPSAGISTPLLGEHTRAIMSEVGYAVDEVERLHEMGVVKTELPARA